MRFKDLSLFNNALPTKQVWRLLHNKQSLCYHIFKARFFLNCSIMQVTESNFGSYAWKSILKGRDVLLSGARWRIGNGVTVSIWKDAWLPSLEHPKIQSPAVDLFSKALVNSLFSPSHNTWNMDLLHQFFSNREFELIKKIPLGQGLSEEKLIWPHVSSSVHTVKSRYNFLSKHKASESQTSSNPSQYQEVWKHVWSCKVPNKVKSSLEGL